MIEPDNVYREADKITDELMKSFIRLEMPDQKYKKKKNYEKYQIFSKCSYLDGILNFKINPAPFVYCWLR